MSKNGIVLYKTIFDDKEECWKWNLSCTPVKVHNKYTDQLLFGDKKEISLSTSKYFILHSIIGEND